MDLKTFGWAMLAAGATMVAVEFARKRGLDVLSYVP